MGLHLYCRVILANSFMRKSEIKLRLETLIHKMDKSYVSSKSIDDAFSILEVHISYTLMDLEATRREREALRRML
jgi:hypothetical protein